MINEAISEVYSDKRFKASCRRYGNDNHEDLAGTVILLLLEMPIEKLQHIIDNNYLLPFAMSMVRNQASGKDNAQWTQFNKNFSTPEIKRNDIYSLSIDVSDPDEYQTKEERYTFADHVAKKIQSDSLDQSNKYFYHSRLIIEKIKHRNVKQLSRVTGIPYCSMRVSITEYKNHLKEWAKSIQPA